MNLKDIPRFEICQLLFRQILVSANESLFNTVPRRRKYGGQSRKWHSGINIGRVTATSRFNDLLEDRLLGF